MLIRCFSFQGMGLSGFLGPNVYSEVPDGGWGWVVAVAFFLVEVFTYGTIKSFGIFLQNLIDEFGETNSRVSWIVSISVFVMAFNGKHMCCCYVAAALKNLTLHAYKNNIEIMRIAVPLSTFCFHDDQPLWLSTCCHDWRTAYYFWHHRHHLYRLHKPNLHHLRISCRYSFSHFFTTFPLQKILHTMLLFFEFLVHIYSTVQAWVTVWPSSPRWPSFLSISTIGDLWPLLSLLLESPCQCLLWHQVGCFL